MSVSLSPVFLGRVSQLHHAAFDVKGDAARPQRDHLGHHSVRDDLSVSYGYYLFSRGAETGPGHRTSADPYLAGAVRTLQKQRSERGRLEGGHISGIPSDGRGPELFQSAFLFRVRAECSANIEKCLHGGGDC